MKQIRIILVAIAAMFLAVSCYERQFTPATGAVEVTFPTANYPVSFTSEYIYLPVQHLVKSTTAARAVVEFVEGTVTLTDGTTRPVTEFTNDEEGYANGGDIIITDYTVVIPGYDPNDEEQAEESFIPSANIEIRVPQFSTMSSLSLTFNLVGEYLGSSSITTTTVEATR